MTDGSPDTAAVPESGHRLRPVARQKLADLAYEAIRDSIITGKYAMGERLVETKIAGELEMSRAPVREALRRLSEEGLTVERPHYGMFIREFDGGEIVDLYNARLAVETTALRLFVRRGASTEPLRAEIERRRAAAARRDQATIVRADFAFHEELLRGSGNAVLYDLFKRLAAHTLIAIALDDSAFEDVLAVADEHVPVVEALERGDEDAAVAAFEAVVTSTVERLCARLGGETGGLLTA